MTRKPESGEQRGEDGRRKIREKASLGSWRFLLDERKASEALAKPKGDGESSAIQGRGGIWPLRLAPCARPCSGPHAAALSAHQGASSRRAKHPGAAARFRQSARQRASCVSRAAFDHRRLVAARLGHRGAALRKAVLARRLASVRPRQRTGAGRVEHADKVSWLSSASQSRPAIRSSRARSPPALGQRREASGQRAAQSAPKGALCSNLFPSRGRNGEFHALTARFPLLKRLICCVSPGSITRPRRFRALAPSLLQCQESPGALIKQSPAQERATSAACPPPALLLCRTQLHRCLVLPERPVIC